jgi:transcriptional regulator with XRE-family HTH domain
VALGALFRLVRQREHLTLRQLGQHADTSHSTLSNYEHGHKVATIETLERVVASTGWMIEPSLCRVAYASAAERADEIAQVLELAAAFPARHRKHLAAPIFGRQ